MQEPYFHYAATFTHDRSSTNTTDRTLEEETQSFINTAHEISTSFGDEPQLKFFRSRRDLYIPRKTSPHSVGWDLYSLPNFHFTLNVGQSKLIPLGIQFEFPEGYYGQLFSKSNLAFHHGIYVQGGVLDPDYEGDIYVLLHNFGRRPFQIQPNMRICQLVLLKYENTIDRLVEVSSWEQLNRRILQRNVYI